MQRLNNIPCGAGPSAQAPAATWTVVLEGAPAILRHCKKCGGARSFSSSGLFRVNANHHVLDVWLIHRCESCGQTWNMEVATRMKPADFPPDLLHGYQVNDPVLALRCAHDRTLLSKNRATACYDGVPLRIIGPDVDLASLAAPLRVRIDCAHQPDIRVRRILREKLCLSASAFKRLADLGQVACDAANIQSAQFIPGMHIALNPAQPSR